MVVSTQHEPSVKPKATKEAVTEEGV